MKVAILTTGFLRHAADTRGLSVYEIAKNLVVRGVNVEVIAPADCNTKPYESIGRIKIARFNYFFPKSMQKLAYGAGMPTNLKKSILAKIQLPFFVFSFILKSLRRCKDCDIIHAQWILSGLAGIIIKTFYKKPVFLTIRRVVHGSTLMKRINKYIIEHVDYVFFNSSYTERKVLEFAKPRNHAILHPTINVDKFRPGLKTGLKKELGIKSSNGIIFSLGLLVEKKGFKYLIKAMSILDKKLRGQTILIIGGQGSEETKLKRLVNDLGLQHNVKFAGEISSKKTPYYYNIADLFVLPSIIDSAGETETFGVVLLEALACGCPVIASNVGGIPDIVEPQVGFLVEQKNERQIANKMEILLRDSKLRKKMSLSARKRILKYFNSGKVAEDLIKKYKLFL